MRKNKLLLLLVLLTMLSTRAVAQDDASAMREQMKERLDELKALVPDGVKGLNETLKNDVKVYTAQYTEWYNASKSYDDYEEAYDNLGGIIDRVNKYLAAYGEFTDNMAKLKSLIQNFNADTEKKQEYKTFAQNVYNAYNALSEHDMIALDDEDLEAQKGYDDDNYWVVPDDVTSDNIADVADRPEDYISTYGQFNAFFSQNTKELGSIYLKVAGTGTAESPEDLTYQLRNPNLENANEQWWGTEWTSIGNSAAEQSGKPFDTYQQVHLPSGYYTLVGYGMDRRGSWADVLANDEDWNYDHRTSLFSHLGDDGDSIMVDAFKAKNMALTADITNGAGNISTCEVDGVTYYTPNSMAQYRAWEDAKTAMAGHGHAAVVQFWVWQDEGDFGTLGFAHPWHVDNTWFVADGIQLYYAKDDSPKINIDTPDCARVTITDDGWATLYTDKALAFSGIKGLTAYTAKRDGSTVTLTPVDNVPANTGVVLKGDAKTYNIPIIASSTTDKGDLQGSATTETAFDAHAAVGGIYVLGLNDTNEAQFEKKTSGNVPARQPYLLVPTAEEPSSALRVVIAGEPTEPTYAVEFAEGTEESDKWTAEPNTGVKKGETVTVTYTGTKKVIGVKAEKKAATPAIDYSTAQLGDLFYSDGTFSTELEAGKTPIGVIAYLDKEGTDDDEICEKSNGAGHGLVLCLKNAASGAAWSTDEVSKFSGQEVNDAAGLKRTTNVSGYSATAALATDATTYPAAAAAKNYTGLTAPTSTTGWFLPSAQQWVKMQTGLGALEESSIKWNSWFDNNHEGADRWEAALSKAGSGNYDSMTSEYLSYWSSSEYLSAAAVRLSVDATDLGEDYGFSWNFSYKGYKENDHRVRPVLAF